MTPKENKINTNEILDSFEVNFERIASTYSITQEKTEDDALFKQKVNLTIAKFAAIEEIPTEFAIIGVCALIQSGAYLKSVKNRRIKINNKEFTKNSLLFATDQADYNYTIRAMAKFLKKIIAKVADTYNIPGHLYARFKIENADIIATNTPELNKKISIYCTDFQIENPDTPPIVRDFLAKREKNRSNNKK